MSVRFVVAVLGLLTNLVLINPVVALEINHVNHEPRMFDPAKQKSVAIKFSLDEAATITLNIFDGRDLLIRKIAGTTQLEKGDHALSWDGKDQAGRPVPPEAYRYTLVAKSGDGRTAEHDLSDLTIGEEIKPEEVKWDAKNQEIQYVLSKPSRVHIRVGIKNKGPFLKGLLDWVPRNAGLQKESWDGWDESKVINLGVHPKLEITVLAYGLSDNTIIVGPKQNKLNLIENITWAQEKRIIKKKHKKRMYAHYQQKIESRGGLDIKLVLPQVSEKTNDGLPIVTGLVPVRMEIAENDASRAMDRGFEPSFFIDGVFSYENEVGFMPITWKWDSSKVNEGVHYITGNLRGYEGNFGVDTLKVYVKRQNN